MRRRTSLTALAAVAALAAAGVSASPAVGATPKRRIAHTAPSWVAKAQSIGNAPAAAKATFKVYLTPHGGLDSLQADVEDISTPGTTAYGKFLSAKQYHAKYDATVTSATKVSSWLKSADLVVTSVEPHRRYLAVTGTNAAVEKAFSISMKKFHHRGRTVQANTAPVAVPSEIAGLVATVTGLDTTPHLIRHNATAEAAPPPDGFRNARPCSKYYGQLAASTTGDPKTPLPKFEGKTLPYAVCGYTGPQYRGAYEGANRKNLTGRGTTVAITDAYASPTIAQDANTYAARHGDGRYNAGQLTQSLPAAFTDETDCDASGWYGEETLDVEAVHAMAPGAKIAYYASASCNDDAFLATLGRVVDDNKASLVSNSWSDLEQNETSVNVAAYEQVFLQGAMQGIGFLYSSGDSGDELASSETKQVDYPASDPYVTAVGGTSDAIGANNRFIFQTGWGTEKYSLSADGKSWTPVGFTSGAGGGVSSLFSRPAYQRRVVPASFGNRRAVPDVGLDADPTTGMLIGQTQTFPEGAHYDEFRLGGTSLASPLFAGMTALRQQSTGRRLGFLNPSIYRNARTGVFTDVKGAPRDAGNVRADYANSIDASGGILYSVRAFNRDSSLKVTRGWDDVTGVGSPNASWIRSARHSGH
jgi:subtilase family serine protease